MSPLDVHVNRNLVQGVVRFARYFPGKYLVAWDPKSSTENEQTFIVVEDATTGHEVGVKQIAGALARRICFYVKEGDRVEQGGEFGFIKFGSRCDLLLPLGTKVETRLGAVVKGGRTLMARLPDNT
jgi:phosphatidylserine decarboxylase